MLSLFSRAYLSSGCSTWLNPAQFNMSSTLHVLKSTQYYSWQWGSSNEQNKVPILYKLVHKWIKQMYTHTYTVVTVLWSKIKQSYGGAAFDVVVRKNRYLSRDWAGGPHGYLGKESLIQRTPKVKGIEAGLFLASSRCSRNSKGASTRALSEWGEKC